jgi:hypothetical protein
MSEKSDYTPFIEIVKTADIIVQAMKKSEFDCAQWDDTVLYELAGFIIGELRKAGKL